MSLKTTKSQLTIAEQRLIRFRKEEPVISDGDIRFILPEENGLIAYERILGPERIAVYCNYTGEQRNIPFEGGTFVMGSYENAPPAKKAALHCGLMKVAFSKPDRLLYSLSSSIFVSLRLTRWSALSIDLACR